MSFKKAERKNAKLRLGVSGTAGAGKTFSSLLIAKVFGKKIAVLDSERGSAALYAGAPGIPDFDVCELEDKKIQEYRAKIREAAAEGYDVLVIDSYSHSWMSALEAIDQMGGWVKGGKTISPLIARLVDDILSYPGHVIATMRSKAEHVIEKDEKTGKNVIKKMGMANVARDGTDYEFSVMIDVTIDGVVTVTKSRCSAIAGTYHRADIPKIAHTLKAWLSEGAPEAPIDVLRKSVRAAADLAALTALRPAIGAHLKAHPGDVEQVQAFYTKRKAELAGEEGFEE